MATYYISYEHGSDSNNGLGPDASHASNKPWKTLGKALKTGSAVVPGDTVYVAPGIAYEGAQITLISGISSSASPTAIRGDPLNAQGFKSSGGVRVAPGPCWVTVRSESDGQDSGTVTPTGAFLVANTNGTSGMQWYDLCIEGVVGPNSGPIVSLAVTTTNCRDWLFQDCRLIGGAVVNLVTGVPTANLNLTVRRCVIITGNAITATINSAPGSADIDLNILFEHNWVLGRASNALSFAAAGGNLAGGMRWKGNTIIAGGSQTATVFASTAGRISTTTPCRLEGNLIIGGASVNAGTSGHYVDDGYNRFLNLDVMVNFTPAGTSKEAILAELILPDLLKWRVQLPIVRPFGWTLRAASAQRQSGWSNTSPDFWGRQVRPWGAGPAVGCFEFGDTTQGTDSQITGGGVNYLKMIGAGEMIVPVRLRGAATSITVITESVSYGGTNYPQMTLLAIPEVGVTEQTATAIDATEQTLTIGPFTPTGNAIGYLILRSRSSSVGSTTRWDRVIAS